MTVATSKQLQDERFLLLQTLGRGGMATVYRAFDRVDQRMVALKVQSEIAPGGPQHPFAAEYEAWSRLSHPNVVQALELCQARSGPFPIGTPYLVLEHVEGGPAHWILRPGHETPETIESFAVEVLQGLSHVHRAGFVHRDLKPSNILMDRNTHGVRTVKLTDFGLAIPRDTADEPGCISGSLPYVSPEALCGLPLDGRADLYGLGVLLYFLTSGTLPVAGDDRDAWVRWHLTGPPLELLRDGRRSISRMARFIRRLGARDRQARPTDADKALAWLAPEFKSPALNPPRGLSERHRADLRLSVDAVRLGAVRALKCGNDGPSRASEPLRREVAIITQVLGMDYYEIRRWEAPTDLDRLVLRMLETRSHDPVALLKRFQLNGELNIAVVGDLPVLDPVRSPWPSASHVTSQPGRWESASAVCRLFLECARQRSLALSLGRRAIERDPRIAAISQTLLGMTRRRNHPRSGAGGLLLLLDTCDAQGE